MSARIDQAELTVERGALGAALKGSFELVLAVGSEASGPSTAELEAFSLSLAQGENVTISVDSNPSFPLMVAPGAEQAVSITITDEGLLTSAEADALCNDSVTAQALIRDSLLGGELLSAVSQPIEANCAVP